LRLTLFETQFHFNIFVTLREKLKSDTKLSLESVSSNGLGKALSTEFHFGTENNHDGT